MPDRTTAGLPEPRPDSIEHYLGQISEELRPLLQRSMDRLADVPALKDGVVSQMLGGGKRLRAALCASVCDIYAGHHRDALGFAAALEHLQNFSLIHDDIADGDEERRGRPSMWHRFGVGHAINIGDAFVPMASLSILEAGHSAEVTVRLLRLISELGVEVAEGQSLDLNLRQQDSPTFEDYVECTRRKTGAFLAMAALGGATIGGADEDQLVALRAFAYDAGVAFQIRDDVLDVTGGKERPVGSDIAEGKRTLLVILAAGRADLAERTRLFTILDRPRDETTTRDKAWVIDLIGRTRARERAEETAERQIQGALRHLGAVPETAAKVRFVRLARYFASRSR
jgi:geranylgeranyl pyrophosphate synthase